MTDKEKIPIPTTHEMGRFESLWQELEQKYPRWFRRKVPRFSVQNGLQILEFAFVMDALYKDREVDYPGQLVVINEARSLTPVIKELRSDDGSESWLSKAAAFVQHWQVGPHQKIAKKIAGDDPDIILALLGERSYQCYLQGLRIMTEDFSDHLPDNLGKMIELINQMHVGGTLAFITAASGLPQYSGDYKIQRPIEPVSPVLSDLMENTDAVVRKFFSYPSVASQLNV